MLYVYYGTDTGKTLDAMMAAAKKLHDRAPEAAIERITQEDETLDLETLLASQGLFHAARVVMLDALFADAARKQAILDALPALASSEHIFFIREGKLLAPEKKKLEKHAAKVTVYDVPEAKKADAFNRFALADALMAGDKKQLWLAYQEALAAGAAPEELHGILFMGAKNLVLAAGAASAEAAGMHPFAFGKAKRAAAARAPGASRALLAALAALPHEARRRGVELEYALELFILAR
ncbi:MAG TPA: hypothetical protein VFL98_03620 [Candidatus Paceibacterota bacterium]|nr:hypothetical protein [Candidatus Paceibacterota bacterium]